MKQGEEISAENSNDCAIEAHNFKETTNKEGNELFRKSESLLLSILAHLPDPIFVKDINHQWVFVNQKICDLIGYSEREILGKSDYDLFTKEQADEIWKTDTLILSEGIENEFVEFISTSKGNIRKIATKKKILIDKNGTKFLVGTIRDITELSLLEKRELQVNKVLKKLALGGSIEEVLSMILEVAEEEFPGMIASILIVDRDSKRLRSIVTPNLPDYFIRAIEGTPIKDEMGSCGTAAFRGETIVVEDIQTHPYWKGVRDLTERACLRSCWSQPIFATDGEIVGTFALYYREPKKPTLVELKLMETMAQVAAISIESYRIRNEKVILRKMLANIIDSMPSVLIGTDTKGKVTQWNLEVENITGIPREKAIGQPLEVVYPKIKTEMSELYEAIRSKEVKEKTKKISVQSMEDRYENITIFPLRANGIEGAVIRVDDVTEREQLEEIRIQHDKLKSIGVLAGGIAHDFNNLLVGILGNIDLASNLIERSNKAYPLLQKAEKASLRAKDLTTQLLTFSKGGHPVRKPVALESLIKESAEFILAGSNVVCKYTISNDVWLVDVDSGQISQVVQNIIINAKEAMEAGGVIEITCENIDRHSIYAHKSLKEEKYVMVKISDTGPGIQKSNLGKIFDPYFTTKQKGSGLGLAVCHSIILKHDGFITVVSTEGAGTTFSIYLPALFSSENIIVEKKYVTKKSSGKVMVMDDEELVRDLISNMLNQLGCETVMASDGEEAVKIYKSLLDSDSPVDLIIMDLTIPNGMGGKEAVQKILEINNKAKVIVFSGYSTDPIISNFKDYGFVNALKKPFKFSELSKVVNAVL